VVGKKGQNHGLLRPSYLVQNRLRSSGVAELVSLQIGQHLSIYFTQFLLHCVPLEHKRSKTMGNQGSSRNGGGGGPSGSGPQIDEPLEAYLREKQRNDHLNNLGLKRRTSLRKSISKKLKRHKKQTNLNDQTSATTATEAIEVVDNGGTNNSKKQQKSHCDVHEEPFRRPSYSGQSGSQSNIPSKLSGPTTSKTKGMDNLRKSFRVSLRRKKDKDSSGSDFVKDRTGGSSKSKLWQQDEIAVRAGTCSFDVKYLGNMEVYESRGMTVCEEALKKLKSSKKKSVRAILYINGDGLRVVDYETKGLLLDQTIEKVSFCAPDHNYERGFSYICRDGTTRRWMCHGFMAVKETGDRLSHAVGCAFAICLEKKQKRDQDCAVTMNFDNSSSSFTRIGSFRQATITERLADPQGIKPSAEPVPKPTVTSSEETNPFAIARPHATELMLQRQTSFRDFGRLQSRTSPFKRQLSLRMSELPSSLERKSNDAAELGSTNQIVVQNSDPFGELCEQFKNQAFFSPSNSVNSSLYAKAELTTVPEIEDDPASLPPPLMASPIQPTKPTAIIEEAEEERANEVEQLDILDDIVEEQETTEEMMDTNKESTDIQTKSIQNLDIDNDFNLTSSDKSSMNPDDSLEFSMKLPNVDTESNPWDLVPDQPAINLQQTTQQKSTLEIISTKPNECLWPLTMKNNTDFSTKNLDNSGQNLMDDPFDADWVSLALNQSNTVKQQQPL